MKVTCGFGRTEDSYCVPEIFVLFEDYVSGT